MRSNKTEMFVRMHKMLLLRRWSDSWPILAKNDFWLISKTKVNLHLRCCIKQVLLLWCTSKRRGKTEEHAIRTTIKTKSNSKSSERVSIEQRDMFTFCTRWSKPVVHGNVKWFYENIFVDVNSTTTYILTSQWMTLGEYTLSH